MFPLLKHPVSSIHQMYFLSSVKNSLKKGQKFVTINDNQCPLSYHGNSQGGKPSLANTSHCHRKKRKTSRVMRMDGLRFEAEERSRLQRLPWHEQIDTIAPPPKCRVLGQVWSASDWGFDLDPSYVSGSSSSGHLQPPGPSGAPPSPHSLLVTVTPSKLPL